MVKHYEFYGNTTYEKTRTQGVHPSLTQDNVQLTPDFGKFILTVLGANPTVIIPANAGPALLSMVGAILRLIRDQIAITEGEKKYYFSNTVSVDYEKMLPESKFFIVDINGDKKLDIGIRFPSNVLLTYYYNKETDTLSQALDHHIYTEILGNGQVMMASSSSTSEATFYNVIDIFGKDISTVVFFEDYMGERILSDGTKVPKYLYSVEVRLRLQEGTRRPSNTISTIDVTKEQWDMMKKPFDDLRENAPKPLNYEELIEVES